MTFKVSSNSSVILEQESEFYTLSLCHLFACKEKMSDEFVLVLSEEDSHACDVPKVTHGHEK